MTKPPPKPVLNTYSLSVFSHFNYVTRGMIMRFFYLVRKSSFVQLSLSNNNRNELF